jgi:hypothetical protein
VLTGEIKTAPAITMSCPEDRCCESFRAFFGGEEKTITGEEAEKA